MSVSGNIFVAIVGFAFAGGTGDQMSDREIGSSRPESAYRDDIPAERARASEDVIRPGDSTRKVVDWLGQPRPQHKQQHFWSYFFAYGTPWEDNTALVTVTVWFDGDRVRNVEVKYRPPQETVQSVRTWLKTGTPDREVQKQLGRPAKIDGNRWSYSWDYSRSRRFSIDVVFTPEKAVAQVNVRSAHFDYF
jgi:hypothetical protein